jgi:hypothetical protein
VNDLQAALPVSVNDAFQIVDNYLVGNNVNDCGITSGGAPSGLIWTFTASGNGCPTAGLTIIVNRGYYYPSTGATVPSVNCASQAVSNGQVALISTCVSIQYGYPWRFARAASLLGASTVLPLRISAVAVALNEN